MLANLANDHKFAKVSPAKIYACIKFVERMLISVHARLHEFHWIKTIASQVAKYIAIARKSLDATPSFRERLCCLKYPKSYNEGYIAIYIAR